MESNERAGRRWGYWTALLVAVGVMASLHPGSAFAHPSGDPLHGGSGQGVAVVGHSDLGGAGLNGHVAVLGNYAYVGAGTNAGFAAQWGRTPTCAAKANTVKIVSLVDPANPTVVSTIDLTGIGETPGATLARAVSVVHVNPSTAGAFSGDLLAVALESCGGDGRLGVDFYDVSNPSTPVRVGSDTPLIGTATRDVSLVQRPDGRAFALEANQSGGIRLVDVSHPAAPLPMGSFRADSGASGQGCRPYSYAQGVIANATGSNAYAAYGDAGLLRLDISNPAPGTTLPKLGQATYASTEEGNSFRFRPNSDETAALATDEDPLPARTTLTVASGAAAGTYSGCETIWGAPLFRRADPSLSNRQIVYVPGGGDSAADYAGLSLTGKLALVDRGSDFVTIAKAAQAAGAAAVVVAGGTVASADASAAGDAGVTIPLVIVSTETGTTLKAGIAGGTVTGTLADNPDTWGALRIFSLSGANPAQTAVFNAPHTNTLTPGDGIYHAVNPVWSGDRALVAWMSDGLRVVDVANRSAPKAGPFYVPPAVADPTGNYGTVPLVVGVATFGSRVVISDINSGLYVLDLPPAAAAAATPAAPSVSAVAAVPPTRGGGGTSLAAALAAEAARQRGLRSCLAGVAAHAQREKRLLGRGSARQRAKARRHRSRHASAGRRRCLRLYGRTPGRITGMQVRALSSTNAELSFNAPGTDGSRPPAARGYLVKVSPSPIRDARSFARARTLCRGRCAISVTKVGARVRIKIINLRPHTTYYYAVAARDNASGRLGPRSSTVKAKTS